MPLSYNGGHASERNRPWQLKNDRALTSTVSTARARCWKRTASQASSKFERRYEMSSEKMAKLLELDAIRPTAEVLEWYQDYYGVQSLLGKIPTIGTPGTTTEPSTKSE